MPTLSRILDPWARDRQPSDVERRHVRDVTGSPESYVVTQGGTMDGENCSTPHGSWFPAEQSWESNRLVRIENVGSSDIVNPWLSNGRNDFRSARHIVAGAIVAGMDEREKALALFHHEVRHRFHATTGDGEANDAVKVHNNYGYTTCGNDAICMGQLWSQAGLRTRPAHPVGHCITEVFWDGAWHLLDADMQVLYLLRDNHGIAGEQEVARDHDLVKRTHTQGLLSPNERAKDEWESSLFSFEAEGGGCRDGATAHTMEMTLRPGEALSYRWGQHTPPKYHGKLDILLWFQPASDTICNGLWEYRPDLTRELWRGGARSVRAVRATPEGLAAEDGKAGSISWTMRSPYVFVGGRLEVEGAGARFSISWDGESWQEAGLDLDPLFPRAGTARYSYMLRCELSGAARLRGLCIVNDLQMARLALPAMRVGENGFTYTDETPGERSVRITHEWVERSIAAPPAPPSAPTQPADGSETEGTDISFRWQAPADTDPGLISDYHFELSEYEDMRWPLSSNFWKLISRTADRGLAQYRLPAVGLLAPDRRYFWRVRARNSNGPWGAWSAVWSFSARAPVPPAPVTMTYDAALGVGTLRWQPSATGRRPARYRIYGSDERGFSVSDGAFDVVTDYSGDFRLARASARFPSCLVTETTETSLVVVGRGLRIQNGNRAYYRVVAVDERGNRSGPSDYAEAPRPFVSSTPPVRARVGEGYEYAATTIRSLGDLRLRHVEGREVLRMWDVEEPRFRLRAAPAWLAIDERTGSLGGTPDSAGRVRVELEVTLEREGRELDPERLSSGHELVVATPRISLGPAKQEFWIDVRA